MRSSIWVFTVYILAEIEFQNVSGSYTGTRIWFRTSHNWSVRGPNTFSQGSVAYTIIYIFFKMCFLRSKDTERANYDKFWSSCFRALNQNRIWHTISWIPTLKRTITTWSTRSTTTDPATRVTTRGTITATTRSSAATNTEFDRAWWGQARA